MLVFVNIFSISAYAVITPVDGSGVGPTTPKTQTPPQTQPNIIPNCPTGKICNPIKATSINTLLASLVSIVKFVAGIVLVIYFILAGFKYVTARGDETKIKAAHSMLTWTAVGGAILLGAEVIQKLITGTINQLGTGL